jgi:outer membrane protein assembly factor BamA
MKKRFWIGFLLMIIIRVAGEEALRFGEIIVNPVNALLLNEVAVINNHYAQQAVTPGSYTALTQRLLSVPVNQGYYYAVLTLQRIEPSTIDGVVYLNPVFSLDWGDQVKVDTLIWSGLQKTEPSFLSSQVAFLQKKVYQPELIYRIKQRLAVFPFIIVLDNPRVVRTLEGNYGLILPVQERNENQFSGAVGYVPAKLGVRGYWAGELNLKLQNLAGRGRSIEIFWSKPNRFSQRLRLRSLIPGILQSDYLVKGEFQQTLRDTLIIIRELNLGSGRYFPNGLEWESQLSFMGTFPTPGGKALLGLKSSNVYTLTNGIKFDRRDNGLAPRRGWLIQGGVGIGRRRSNSVSTWQLQIETTSEFYLPVGKNWTLAAGTTYKGRFSEVTLNYGDYYWFGGARSLRGYPEEFFAGTQVGWSTFEWRWQLAGQSRVFLFYDQGYYKLLAKQRYPHSFGLGFRLSSRLGLLGIDYGFGEGDSFTTAKIHVHLENWF